MHIHKNFKKMYFKTSKKDIKKISRNINLKIITNINNNTIFFQKKKKLKQKTSEEGQW